MTLALRLLLIEDSQDDSDLLLRHLKKGGFELVYERVESEASMCLALDRKEWDTIICDYNLPSFNTLSAITESKKRKPQLPFIIVSGSIGEEVAVEALKAGANDYILKNNLARLIPAIKRELKEASLHLEQQKIQEELVKKDEALRQAHKLEALGQLAGGIAHDFNNILAIILMQTDVLTESLDTPLTPKSIGFLKKGLEQIQKSGGRASNLTRQLLAFSRKQVVQSRVLNLNEIVTDMEKMLRPIIEENISFKLILSHELWNIKVDPGHIEQIIMNLVVNSRDAMPKGGMVTIETSNTSIDPQLALRCNAVSGPYIQLSITDTGCGMDEDTQKCMFDPFFTTKSVGKGTGLGLSTVYGIVKQNNGLIFVDSEVGKGTTFKIYFPQNREKPQVVAPIAMESSSLHGTETVLVVEDEEDLRELACENLKSHGYTILQASDGMSALELLKNYEKDIHLVVTDVIMPKLGGSELAKRAQGIKKNLKFLFLSGYTEDILLRQGINTGQIHFLEKPYALKVLLKKIRTILE